jgi:hypothetical protein
MTSQEESSVPDNRSYRRNRRRMTTGEAYNVSYFARRHAISHAEAERIIRRARGNRARANALCTLIKKQFLVA